MSEIPKDLELDKEHHWSKITAFAEANGYEIQGYGPKLYDDNDLDGELFLTLTEPDGDDSQMTFVWMGDAGGAIYKRTT